MGLIAPLACLSVVSVVLGVGGITLWCDYRTGSPQTDFGARAENKDHDIEIKMELWLADVGTEFREDEDCFVEDRELKEGFQETMKFTSKIVT